jgi:riboflavin synthase
MFTGIVEAHVPVLQVTARGEGVRLILPRPGGRPWEVALGDSIAVSGACLTVAELGAEGEMAFDLSRETLLRTWFGALGPGSRVNLERALRMGARLDGHLVSGHVDGGGTLVEVVDSGDGGRELWFEVDEGLERYLVDKGSITVDGVSLTVVRPEAGRFGVALIPLTLELTTLSGLAVGDRVNLEADMIGKWVERLMPPR